ncbi:hypothetical protein UlMin_016248 [Ulmus minor]
MPFISDAASAIKSRFGFHDRSAADAFPSVRSTPDLHKSASKDDFSQTSIVRNIRDWDDLDDHNPQSDLTFELREDPAFWKDHNVQVIIRIRPLSSIEISLQGHSKCVRQESCQTITWTGHPESRFTFDLVADEHVSQENLFKVAGLPMVDNCMGGYNSCMFAYGQTGSGKTHTMLGDIEGGTRRHSVNCGMTPRVFEYLFSRIQKEKEARRDEKLKFICKCSFLEIYNEQILDLLDPSSINLQIREDVKKGVYVENLKEIEVTSARDVIQQLIEGAANRKVAATNMNLASSRSHSVFTCIIESKWDSQGVTHHRFARLNLVDLAGSERQKSSGAEGERLKEATNINKSLSTLGLVIMNLVNISNGKSLHVPYRDSKLTFLLQDSLGGNSKTTIIANISPSSCCSLETLSTLKFAQRAKFIKNNAIVNEDASGNVIAMRMQIQQLKKEVSRLRGLVSGGAENQDNDTMAVSFPGSPGSFNWEGLDGSFSPLATGKRISQKKDYEAALVGAFRREKDKDMALKALTAENQAAMQLAKQREDEIQGLKMRLRFREAGIKRLEAVASGKISAETHLLKEKEEHLKELEMLRTQVNRNQEVTRFAMENLTLKEEIRRLKAFCEEGERDMLNDQITVLQNKLLEALDWKLMHESDLSMVQKTNSDGLMQEGDDDNLLISNKESGLPWQPSINEENEFLRMQAIQNQAEMDSLRKNLERCLDEKEKLERDVNDLMTKLEEERSSKAIREGTEQVELPSLSSDVPTINLGDQMELKTMVDAIAAASQREAEAHETAITLSKEKDELRLRIKVLLEDNNKLIELYERATTELQNKTSEIQDEVETNKVVENLEHQLMEMHEENEKLMGLYEQAMQERDEFKRVLSSGVGQRNESKGEFDCAETVVKVDGEEQHISRSPISEAREIMGQIDHSEDPIICEEEKDSTDGFGLTSDVKIGDLSPSRKEIEPLNCTTVKVSDDLSLVRTKLEMAEKQLLDSGKALYSFGSLEKLIVDIVKLSRDIEVMEEAVLAKKKFYESLKLDSSELQEKRALIQKKLSAIKYPLSNFSSSVAYYEQREARATSRVVVSKQYLDRKKEELASLQRKKEKIQASMSEIQQSELELSNKLSSLQLKLEEENRKQENGKVLLAIENVEKVEPSQRNWNLGGKATELLKSAEEKPKLQAELRVSRERLGDVRKELEVFSKKYVKVESEIQAVEVEVENGSRSFEELERALNGVLDEKKTLLELIENAKAEIESTILEYQQRVFEANMKEEEMKFLEEELVVEETRIEELRKAKAEAAEKTTLLLDSESSSGFVSEKMEGELQSVRTSVMEAKMLLAGEVN